MNLYDLLDKDLLEKHIQDGYVNEQKHPTLPLRIFNYSQKAQFEPKWGDGVIDYCRGLIVDVNGLVISRPFKKFHNLQTESIPETLEANLPATQPLVTMKLDGSLGIHYWYDGHEGIATRGSFTSPQAVWATDWYHKYIKEFKGTDKYDRVEWPYETTALFEIIYSENRVVVHYDFEGLVLIGLVDVVKGYEWKYPDLKAVADWNNIKVVSQVHAPLNELKQANNENEEGYVLTYFKHDESPLKVKVKMADYVRLHKIITGMNARSVWERLSSGEGVDRMSSMPEHFKKWLFSWRDRLTDEFNRIHWDALAAYGMRPYHRPEMSEKEYRKIFAEYVKTCPQELHGVLFNLLDKRDPDSVIWRMIKPRGDDRSFQDE